ncbi:MAG: MATE family efflux transporter [Eggerthella lenta]
MVGPVGLVSISNATNAAHIVNAFVIGLTAGGGVVVARFVGRATWPASGARTRPRWRYLAGSAASPCWAWRWRAQPSRRTPCLRHRSRRVATPWCCAAAARPFLMNPQRPSSRRRATRALLQLVGVSALVNVALDLVLVTAGLGVVGAAWATVVAQSVAAVGALVVVRRRFPGGRLAGAFSRGSDVPVGTSVVEVLRVGVPSAVQMAVVNLSYALVTGLLNRYGTDVAAAAGVGLQISTIAGLPCWAIGQAITTAAARTARRVRRADVARIRRPVQRERDRGRADRGAVAGAGWWSRTA